MTDPTTQPTAATPAAAGTVRTHFEQLIADIEAIPGEVTAELVAYVQ